MLTLEEGWGGKKVRGSLLTFVVLGAELENLEEAGWGSVWVGYSLVLRASASG